MYYIRALDAVASHQGSFALKLVAEVPLQRVERLKIILILIEKK